MEMGTILKFCPKCSIYRVDTKCANGCDFGKYEIKAFEKVFDWNDEKYGMIFTAIVTGVLLYFAQYFWAAVFGIGTAYIAYTVINGDRVWSFDFNVNGYYVKRGKKILEGNWEDNPAIYHFPNPSKPQKLILIGRTINLTEIEMADKNQGINRMEILYFEKEEFEFNPEIKNKEEMKKQFRNYARKQFESKNLWYILLNTELDRNPAPNLLRVLKFSNIKAASDLIANSLDPNSNSSKVFSYGYWNTLGKCNSGWNVTFDSYNNICKITNMKTSKFGEDKNYTISLEGLKPGNSITYQSKMIGSDNLLIHLKSGVVSLKFVKEEQEHQALYSYLVEKGYLKTN